ncbi:PREDICTED: tricyclene synthase EBOS, chloroplastic-like [Ipomoea nil]|uniref:tricyclene synthase EBOS, chloroplastic-like n=1 Tax=Ipomoea nil TaxID=35883 RepID=UPI000901F764|nr:PREDICTED: tricyclene synthase EBOS, chloroplastic-like [Ipomoea nil]
MSLHLVSLSPFPSKLYKPKNFPTKCPRLCYFTPRSQISQVERPSPNYKPTIWTHDFVMSLKVNNVDEELQERAENMEEEVRRAMGEVLIRPWQVLELIDEVQRLGLGHRFEDDILEALERVVFSIGLDNIIVASPQKCGLVFKLFRQHGFDVSQDMFSHLMDENGEFIPTIQNDTKGILSLYEASFLTFDGENILQIAKPFLIKCLKNLMAKEDCSLSQEVSHALELPQYYRPPRLEARWYIEECRKTVGYNDLLLELATLDFNMVQSLYQIELQEVSRWWKDIGLASKLSFVRDRLVECYIWAAGVTPQPQLSKARIGLTKVSALITTIDDIYDVYGSPNELQLFTNVVKKWDLDGVKDLPDYMKICFLALYNTVNELGYDTVKEQGVNSIPILAKKWADMCEAFLVEATWNSNKVTPSLKDYLENAWVSVSGSVILSHTYFLVTQNITHEALDALQNYNDLLRWSSMIFRLCNDLGTSKAELERGETANLILCHMRESGHSEDDSRDYIRCLLDEAWKNLNKNNASNNVSRFGKTFIEAAINLARISQCTYQHGDGHGAPDTRSRNRVLSLIIQPLALREQE